MLKKYKAFISYRRNTGSEIARIIYEGLKNRRLKTFLDVDHSKPGPFPKALEMSVKDSYTLLAIICPGDLNDRGNEEDYYFKEIECAIQEGICVIPILSNGFTFENNDLTPDTLKELSMYENLTYGHAEFTHFIRDVARFVRNEFKKKLESDETSNAEKEPDIEMDKDYAHHKIDITKKVSSCFQEVPSAKFEFWKWRFDELLWHKKIYILNEFSINIDFCEPDSNDLFDKLAPAINNEREFEKFIKAIEDNEK